MLQLSRDLKFKAREMHFYTILSNSHTLRSVCRLLISRKGRVQLTSVCLQWSKCVSCADLG